MLGTETLKASEGLHHAAGGDGEQGIGICRRPGQCRLPGRPLR